MTSNEIYRNGEFTESITSSDSLATIMAAKAKLMAGVIENVLSKPNDDSSLAEQMEAFKKVLIPDITPKAFADVYAQTIAYWMFVARLHHNGKHEFSREEAARLIPKTNPFLRKLFQTIAGYDLDERINWIVDDLVEAFKATDVKMVMAGFGEDTEQNDPMIHFYEDFLSAYDPALRKQRGVWYTPQAVVNFIVRAVDEILQKEFNLPKGLADTSKTKIKFIQNKINADGSAETVEKEEEVHKVQILDPAAGTGTFLAETVRHIHGKFKKQAGMWQSYVEEHLIPRLNGFELLMAPYTMAHVKLDWLLSQTGFEPRNNQRLHVYLTNSLEKYHFETGSPFAQFLAREANEANRVKRDSPVMVVLGNPPYSGISQNNSEWISDLIDDYKYVDGEHFNERKHWLNDDYVKFIRLGQEFVDKNNEGVLAYINNHSFIDNPTFRGMRWNLMKSFDKIYIIDLHGNAKKKEVCPDGSKDENVFDIQQGVSINIFVKTGRKKEKELAKIHHLDIYGLREEKYSYLRKSKFGAVPFVRVKPTAPFYFFMPKNEDNRSEYEQGFRIDELMPTNVCGIVTARDSLVVDINKRDLLNRITDFSDPNNSDNEVRQKYSLKDTRGWKLPNARKIISSFEHSQLIKTINYRPFDIRHIYYHPKMVDWGREKSMLHFVKGSNIGVCVIRISRDYNFSILVTNEITDKTILSSKDNANVFPLYLYTNESDLYNGSRTPNLAANIIEEISDKIKLKFEAEKSTDTKKFAPIDVLDYIYAVLHNPAYREKYKEFLKIDFPRVPYPETAKQFRKLAKSGEKLRRLHLLDGVEPKQGIADYPIRGTNEVDKPSYDKGTCRVYINSTQYFDKVPPEAWEFYIGGYQPAQKWLKDRKGRKLDHDDIAHYQKIVLVLRETGRVMGEIEGWGGSDVGGCAGGA